MKLLFVTGLYPKEYEDELRKASKGLLHNAPNVYQWAVIDGLSKNNINFEVVSLPFLPAYPIRYKEIRTPHSPINYKGNKIGEMLSFNNLMVYKTISIEKTLNNFVQSWIKKNLSSNEKLIILTYTPYHPFVAALKDFNKSYKVQIVSIVTDLVDDMFNFKFNRTFFKSIQCYYEIFKTKKQYKYIDKYILLTKAMEDRIPEAKGHNIVVEGISNYPKAINPKPETLIKSFLYSGTLESYACVDDLISAFMNIKIDNIRLTICGSGPLKHMIEEAASKDHRINFKGLVTREEAVELQRQATVLVNPRRPNGGITKYSFPSKTMEYLSSGTPMIGYKLEGIPDEYYPYFYTVNSNNVDDLISTMINVISLPQDELNKKAKLAYDFIKEKKSSESQVQRIINFLQE